MAYFPTLLFSGVTQGAALTPFAAGALSANVIKDFFLQLFLHPGDHFFAVAAIVAVPVASAVGVIFLTKMVYEKYCPDR